MKYDLMVLNQDLSKVVPTSNLHEELMSGRSVLQERISKLEAELSIPEPPKPIVQSDVRRIQNQDGKVRIWKTST
jgi:hypothetical protein